MESLLRASQLRVFRPRLYEPDADVRMLSLEPGRRHSLSDIRRLMNTHHLMLSIFPARPRSNKRLIVINEMGGAPSGLVPPPGRTGPVVLLPLRADLRFNATISGMMGQETRGSVFVTRTDYVTQDVIDMADEVSFR
jgi:hypothetical protein